MVIIICVRGINLIAIIIKSFLIKMTNNHPDFTHCPKKLLARQTTIIDVYRKYLHQSLPSQKQYWTLCATNVMNGELQEQSELGQIFSSGLISLNQYYGVDYNEAVIEKNRQCNLNVNWICGDFLDSIKSEYKKGNFNPGIINADFIWMPKKSLHYIVDIMDFLNHIKVSEVLLVCNMVLRNPYSGKSIDTQDFFDMIKSLKEFKIKYKQGNYRFLEDVTIYSGTGRDRTYMGTINLIKD